MSILAFHSPEAIVAGLDQTPRSEWPNVVVVHLAFQIMVGLGTLLIGVALLSALLVWKRRHLVTSRLYLRLLVLCSPLGFIALEAGWIVTEAGRQPWIIYHIMKTSEAVTTMPGLKNTLAIFTFLYFVLSAIVVWLMARHIVATPSDAEIQTASGAGVLSHA